ncbi:MAG: prepilin-type N-terminal cleavage/methylation domain-containing protein [Lachnospiraceae bacterium]|nr:prepilin-type N-terminal cleavage/methylation domain-containing protein [Lachnospiraceae bacterium]
MAEDNKGYTLIELIVSILVSSIVLLALLGFLVAATKSYRLSNAEVTLQLESQVTSNQIGERIIASKKVEFNSCYMYMGEMYKVLVISGMGESGECNYFYIHNKKRNELLFAKEEEDLNIEIDSVIGTCLNNQESLLTRFITDFDVKAIAGTYLYQLSMTFECDGRTFITSQNISSRNEQEETAGGET